VQAVSPGDAHPRQAAREDVGRRAEDHLIVSIDADRGEVERYLTATPLLCASFSTPAGRRRMLQRRDDPLNFVLDPEGRVVERIDGEADWTNPELLRRSNDWCGTVLASSGTGRRAMRP